jgi:hypothetical protein
VASVTGPGNWLRLHDVSSGKQVRAFLTGERTVAAAAFSPDGSLLATASYSGRVRVWELATGIEVYRLEGHADVVPAVVFSPDGAVLATGGKDRTIRLWGVDGGKELRRLTGHRGGVTALAFDAGGRRLASASEDITALVWDVGSVVPAAPPARELTAKELDALWAGLASKDPRSAHRAFTALLRAPRQAVPLLAGSVRPVVRDEPRIARLISDLESRQFKVRRKAAEDLAGLAELAEPALRKALAGKPTLEVRKQIDTILAKLPRMLAGPVPTPERLRVMRTVALLERAGTPPARQALRALARGAKGARESVAARAALDRLGPDDPAPLPGPR